LLKSKHLNQFLTMNTRIFTNGLKCTKCEFRTENVENELQLRNHFRYHHKDQNFSIKDFRPKSTPVHKVSSVKRKTLEKRVRTASKLGCSSTTPRQCASLCGTGKRCKNFMISSAESAQLVRCASHPLQDIEFAKLRGVFGTPLSYVTVKSSTIANAGNGVFTTALGSYREGDFITQFCGTLMNEQQVLDKQHNAQHTMYCSTFTAQYLSGLTVPTVGKGVGSFVNRRDEQHESNAKCVLRYAKTENESVWIVAVKDIKPGSELFIPYGNSFKLLV
jgi:hypothetical protein